MKQQAFKQALLDAALEEFQDIPAEKDIDLELSAGFEEMGRRLLEKPQRKPVRTLGRGLRRAILIAAIIAALAITAMAVPAIREGLIKFFEQNAGTHYEFTFDPEQVATAPKTLEKEYAPTYIPEGYSEIGYILTNAVITRDWVSEDNEYIMYLQQTIPDDGTTPYPNAENVTTETLNLNGYKVFSIHSQGYMFHWTDNEYFYQLVFGPSITKKECIKVFNSIAPVENSLIPDAVNQFSVSKGPVSPEYQLEDIKNDPNLVAKQDVITILNIDGYEVYSAKYHMFRLYWRDEKYFYELSIRRDASDDEAIKIFRRVIRFFNHYS